MTRAVVLCVALLFIAGFAFLTVSAALNRLSDHDRANLFYAALLKDAGCSTNAAAIGRWTYRRCTLMHTWPA